MAGQSEEQVTLEYSALNGMSVSHCPHPRSGTLQKRVGRVSGLAVYETAPLTGLEPDDLLRLAGQQAPGSLPPVPTSHVSTQGLKPVPASSRVRLQEFITMPGIFFHIFKLGSGDGNQGLVFARQVLHQLCCAISPGLARTQC